MSIVLDPETTDITSSMEGTAKGTYRWMSPELFYPDEFGLSRFQLTKESDCYAFGMVVYEVSSAQPSERLSLQISSARHRFSQGRSPSRNSNSRGRYRSRYLKEPARGFRKIFLRTWRNFGISHKNVGAGILGIGHPSQQFLASSMHSLLLKMLHLSYYANPNRCR